MNVRIVSRGAQVPENVKSRTEQLVHKLVKFDPRLTRAEIIFDEQKREFRVEAILYLDRVDPVVARAESDDLRGAVDALVEKLQRQLRDGRERATDHQAEKLSSL